MSHQEKASWGRLAHHFTDQVYSRNRAAHVQRVAPWVGLIVMGLDELGVTKRRVPSRLQLFFEYEGQWYKVWFNHRACPRGGLVIVEVASDRSGAKEGKTISVLRSIEEARAFYNACREGRWPTGWRK